MNGFHNFSRELAFAMQRFCLFSWVFVFGASAAVAQIGEDPVLRAWASFPKVSGCAVCHANSAPAPNIAADAFSRRGDFSRQNEAREWVSNDKHAIARLRVEPLLPVEQQTEKQRLQEKYKFTNPRQVDEWVGPSNELSRRICDQMGLNLNLRSDYRKFAIQCLSCHGGYLKTDDNQGQPAFSRPSISTVTQQPGIDCLYCHQEPAQLRTTDSKQSEWIAAHAKPDLAWRVLPPETKSAQGMRDLVTVSLQADLCNDCHIGNMDKGMFVTHQMYAAGHPPLPAVELETFSRSMPQHWRSEGELAESLRESKYAGRELYFAVNFPITAKPTVSLEEVYWNTRKLLIGSAASERRVAELVAAGSEHDNPYWGDYAMYDCAACHHELREPSLRQKRGFQNAPGRPSLHEWPSKIIEAIDAGQGSSSLASSLKDLKLRREQLDSAVAKKPFGDRELTRANSAALVDSLNTLLGDMETTQVFDSQFAIDMIGRLSDAEPEELLEYSTARQVLWAIIVMTRELEQDPKLAGKAKEILLPTLLDEVSRWQSSLRGGGTLVSTGAVGIAAALPAGRGMFIYRDNLGDELRRRSAYEPEAFAASLERIRTTIESIKATAKLN